MIVEPFPSSSLPTEPSPEVFVDKSVYFTAPSALLDMSDLAANGAPTGRLIPALRSGAQMQDGRRILESVEGQYANNWTEYGQIGGPGGQELLTAYTQLAVTGSRAFAECPGFAAADLKVTDAAFADVPETVANSIIEQIERDYDAAFNAVRSPLAGVSLVNQDRAQLGWIAVSGEDDSPDFPVNVRIAPFPQYKINVKVPTPAMGEGMALDLQVRCFVASSDQPPDPEAGPFFPSEDEVILFIHGEGSRAEEALDFIAQLHAIQGDGRSFTVVSLDLPGCGYTTCNGVTPSHTEVSPMPNPSTFGGKILTGAPPSTDLLDFIEATIVAFVAAVIEPAGNPITAVIGGSLGGHMALRFAASDLSWVKNVVAWSPASVWDDDVSFGWPVSVTISQSLLTVPELIKRMQPPQSESDITAARWKFINSVWYQDTFPPPGWTADILDVAGALVASGAVALVGEEVLGWLAGVLGQAVIMAATIADLVGGLLSLPTVPVQPDMWYRDDWPGPNDTDNAAKVTATQEDLYDRQEIYNENFRAWHWRICMDCLVYRFDPATIKKPLLLMAGEKDDYAMVEFATNVHSFGTAVLSPGLGYIVPDTGHSIHNERPLFLATELIAFAPPGNVLAVVIAPEPAYDQARTYTVTVTDARTKAPVAGATLTLLNEVRGVATNQTETTDAHGMAEFSSVTLGTTTVVSGTEPPFHTITIRPTLRAAAPDFAQAMFVLWPGELVAA